MVVVTARDRRDARAADRALPPLEPAILFRLFGDRTPV
jgi:hypothetical protein